MGGARHYVFLSDKTVPGVAALWMSPTENFRRASESAPKPVAARAIKMMGNLSLSPSPSLCARG